MTSIRHAATKYVEMGPLELGEGARWFPNGPVQVDLLAGRLISVTDPATVLIQLDIPVGTAAPRTGGGIAIVAGTGVRLFNALDDPDPLVINTGLNPDTFRVNDATVDAHGRLYFGLMRYDGQPGTGSLWRLDPDLNLAQIANGFTIPNGPAIDPNLNAMYLSDSARGLIFRYDLDPATGVPGPAKPFAVVRPGSPDGMAVDDTGCLWSAIWGEARLHRYSPHGRLDEVVMLPVQQPTSLALDPSGGPAVVTSARYSLTSPHPHEGRTMWVDLGVVGLHPGTFSG